MVAVMAESVEVARRRSPGGGLAVPESGGALAELAARLRACEFALRWNLRACRTEFAVCRGPEPPGPLDHAWRVLDRAEALNLWAALEARFREERRWPNGRRNDDLDSIALWSQVDPFEVWLSELPVWDRVSRLGRVIDACFDVSAEYSPEYVAYCSEHTLVNAVWRTLNAPYRSHETVVLAGPQGCGKSSFVEAMLPREWRSDWWSGDFHLQPDTRRMMYHTRGRVVVEIPELRATNKLSLAEVKSYLSQESDTEEVKYSPRVETVVRRFVFVATTNDVDSLPDDPTGNRRYVPLQLVGGDPRRVGEVWDRWRDQLWAEAVALHDMREERFLHADHVLYEEAASHQDRHRSRDDVADSVLQELVAEYAYTHPRYPGARLIDVRTLAESNDRFVRLGLSAKRVAALLAAEGCRKQNRIVRQIGAMRVQVTPWLIPEGRFERHDDDDDADAGAVPDDDYFEAF